MILVDNFRIFVLVVGLCGTLIRPSDSAATCVKADGTDDTCGDATAAACGFDFATGAAAGCVADASAGCPPSVPTTGDVLCDASKCCCNTDKCNEYKSNKDKICTEAHLKTTAACAGGGTLKCHGNAFEEVDCKADEVCGVKTDGTMVGCVAKTECGGSEASGALKCEAGKTACCCNVANCNNNATVCAEPGVTKKPDACGGGPPPSEPTSPAPPKASSDGGGDGTDGGSERSTVTLSVGSLVAIASVAGLSHRISSSA